MSMPVAVRNGYATLQCLVRRQDVLRSCRPCHQLTPAFRLDPSTPAPQLDPTIYESLQKEKVEVGDVIYIEANSGAVRRQGRSDTFATEYDLEVGSGGPLAPASLSLACTKYAVPSLPPLFPLPSLLLPPPMCASPPQL